MESFQSIEPNQILFFRSPARRGLEAVELISRSGRELDRGLDLEVTIKPVGLNATEYYFRTWNRPTSAGVSLPFELCSAPGTQVLSSRKISTNISLIHSAVPGEHRTRCSAESH